MSRPVRVLYFAPQLNALTDGIFHAQVLGQACALTRAGGFECMVVGAECGAENVRKAKAMPQMAALAAARVYDRLPAHRSYGTLRRVGPAVARDVRGDALAFKPDYVYIRGHVNLGSAGRLASACGARLVFDLRGLVGVERVQGRLAGGLAARAAARLRAAVLSALELRALCRADKLLTVSKAMRQWIADRAGRTDVAVVPCCVDADEFRDDPAWRAAARAELGWGADEPAVIYSGSMSEYQRIGDTLRLLAGAQKLLPRLRVLMLTRDAGAAERAGASGLAPGSVTVRSAAPAEVPRWLCAADAGILLRHNTLMNNVASPVKVGEYLACGLPILCSEGVGESSAIIADEKVGLLLRDADMETSAPRAVAEFMLGLEGPRTRAAARRAALKHLAWTAYIDTYRRVYLLDDR